MNRGIVMNLREMIKSELSVIVQEMMINCYTYSNSLYGKYIIQLEDKKGKTVDYEEATKIVLNNGTVFARIENVKALLPLNLPTITTLFKENTYLIKRLRENENFIKISLNGESEDTIKWNTKDVKEWNIIFIEVLHILVEDAKAKEIQRKKNRTLFERLKEWNVIFIEILHILIKDEK